MFLLLASCLLFEDGMISVDVKPSIETVDTAIDDLDGDGFTVEDGDCDDERAEISPEAEESCDGVDNNCDGNIDLSSQEEGDLSSGFLDADQDGFGGGQILFGCASESTWSEITGDCNDDDNSINPNASEVCDNLDNDCDDLIDDDDSDVVSDLLYFDGDGDGFGGEVTVQSCDTQDLVELTGDCDDTDPFIHPGIEEEFLDLIDQDCDGSDIETFEQCSPMFGQDLVECSEVLDLTGILIPFQRIEQGIGYDGSYVITRPFSMMSVEMTNQMAAFLQFNASLSAAPLEPVSEINWFQAAQLANNLTDFVNQNYTSVQLSQCYECANNRCTPKNPFTCTGYRLPTNGEWDLASRAGTSSDFALDGSLPDGGSIDSTCEMSCNPCDTTILEDPNLDLLNHSWFCINSDQAMPVRQTIPNSFGLFDMQGNVAEWVHDRYNALPAELLVGVDPYFEASVPEKSIIRGGSWAYAANILSNDSNNIVRNLNEGFPYVGLRLIRTLPY